MHGVPFIEKVYEKEKTEYYVDSCFYHRNWNPTLSTGQ